MLKCEYVKLGAFYKLVLISPTRKIQKEDLVSETSFMGVTCHCGY